MSTIHENQRLDVLITGYLACNTTIDIIPSRILDLILAFYNQQSTSSNCNLITFPSQLSPKQKQHLTYGFVRHITTSFLIPELIQLCVQFYDEVYHWIIKSKQLTDLELNNKIYSKPFNYYQFIFKYSLVKQINKFTKQMVFSKHIEIVTAPTYIKEIALYSEIECKTNNDKWKSTRILSSSKSQGNINANIGSIADSEVKQNNIILFDNIIQIIRINMIDNKPYIPMTFDKYCLSNVCLNAITKFEWKVDRKYLEDCRLGQTIFSPNSENNTFTMQLRPIFRETTPNCLFGVRLLALPKGIKKIDTTVMYSNNNMDTLIKNWKFSYVEAGMGHIMEINQLIGNKHAHRMVTNVVTVTVHDIYDTNDELISRDDWETYGVYY
eukprot:428821_1